MKRYAEISDEVWQPYQYSFKYSQRERILFIDSFIQFYFASFTCKYLQSTRHVGTCQINIFYIIMW
jgi:hypothetical protein